MCYSNFTILLLLLKQTVATIIWKCRREGEKTPMALLQDLTRQIRGDIDLMVNNKRINALLISAERMLGFQRKQISFCNVDLLHFFFAYGFLSFRHLRNSDGLFAVWLE